MRSTTVLLALSSPLLALAAPLKMRAASANTLLVLQFAHVLEQLESTFYSEALAKFQTSDFTTAGFSDATVPTQQFNTILLDESTHRDVLASTIQTFGAEPLSCSFDFSSVLTDVKTMAGAARLVENLGVSAYLGGATLIDDPQIVTAAASILTVEARHQTILNLLSGGSTIASAFDMVLSPPQVLATAAAFIKGPCDLGITPNAALAITNTGPVGLGTQLSLSSPAINGSTSNLFCQMMVGGAATAITLPFDNCVVPAGINGLVYIYVTNTDQPLLSNIQEQFAASIVAGPTGAFIDTSPESISAAVISGSTGSAAATNSGSSNSGSSGSSDSGSSSGSASSAAGGSVSTATISPDAASALAASATASASGSTPTGGVSNAGASAASGMAASASESAPGAYGGVMVIGSGSMPARR